MVKKKSNSNLKPGQIRHPKNIPNAIMKCIGPVDSETFDKEGKITKLDVFVLTKSFPKHHFIIIADLLNNYMYPEHKFCVAHLITHSNNFDNAKITDDLYDKTFHGINLTNSYVTRDKFLLLIADIDDRKIFGYIDLIKLRYALEY